MTSILHAVQIPLCHTCHRQLKQQCRGFWAIGIVISSVLAALLGYFGPQLVSTVRDIPVGLLILGLVVFVALSAWVTAWILREVFVQSRLAKYDPNKPRLAFGNQQYQALFDRANDMFSVERASYGA